MRIQNILISLFVLLSIVVAGSDYLNVGVNNDAEYNTVHADFYNRAGKITTDSRSSVATAWAPLVGDLDNNGTREIIYITTSGFDLYEYVPGVLVPKAGYPFSGQIGPPILFDIDGDGKEELIAVNGSHIDIIEYSGGTLSQQMALDWISSSPNYVDGEAVMACRAENECLLVTTDSIGRLFTGHNRLKAYWFSGTELNNTLNIADLVSNNQFYCMPDIRSMPVSDHKLISNEKFFFSVMETDITSNDYIQVYSIWMNDTSPHNLALFSSNVDVEHYGLSTAQTCTAGRYGEHFTSPVVGNTEVVGVGAGNEEEIHIGYLDVSDAPTINQLSSNLISYNERSAQFFFSADAISNVMYGSFFEDTGQRDVCLVGFDDDTELHVVCTSTMTNTFKLRQYEIPLTGDIPDAYNNYDRLAHAGHYINIIHKTADYSAIQEVVTSYGVLHFDDPDWSCRVLGDCEGEIHLANPFVNGSIVPADVQRDGNVDFIGQRGDIVFYIDDGRVNNQSQINGAYEFNPCILSRDIKNNSKLAVSFTCTDDESDTITSWATLYDGDANNHSTGPINTSTGTLTDFPANELRANKTGTYVLALYCTDEHHTTPDREDYLFDVALEGEEYPSDCVSSGSVTPSAPYTGCSDDHDCSTSQKCVSGACIDRELEDLTDALLPGEIISPTYRPLIGLLIVLLVMAGAVAVTYGFGVREGQIMLVMAGSAGLLAWLGCVMLKIIPGWTIVLGVLLGSLAVGFKILTKKE